MKSLFFLENEKNIKFLFLGEKSFLKIKKYFFIFQEKFLETKKRKKVSKSKKYFFHFQKKKNTFFISTNFFSSKSYKISNK